MWWRVRTMTMRGTIQKVPTMERDAAKEKVAKSESWHTALKKGDIMIPKIFEPFIEQKMYKIIHRNTPTTISADEDSVLCKTIVTSIPLLPTFDIQVCQKVTTTTTMLHRESRSVTANRKK